MRRKNVGTEEKESDELLPKDGDEEREKKISTLRWRRDFAQTLIDRSENIAKICDCAPCGGFAFGAICEVVSDATFKGPPSDDVILDVGAAGLKYAAIALVGCCIANSGFSLFTPTAKRYRDDQQKQIDELERRPESFGMEK